MNKIILIFVLMMSSYTLSAQYQLHSSVFGGGAVSSGGSYTLRGSVFQPNTGLTEGTGYSMKVGFWAGYRFKAFIIPTVSTTAANTITTTSAVLGGNVSDAGSSAVDDRGIVYSTSDQTPTIGEDGVTKVQIGTGAGIFSQTFSDLTPGTTYYYNSYAHNASGTSYGTASSFITVPLAPAANAATNLEVNSFSANWTASTGASKYYLDVATDNTFNSYVSGFENKDVSDVATYSVTGLTNNTTYYYRVRAYNAGGTSSNSSTITAVTPKAYFSANETQYASWSDVITAEEEGNTILMLDDYALNADVNITKNFRLNLSGYNFTGSGKTIISDGKILSILNTGADASFSGTVSFAGTGSTFTILKSNVIGENFAVDAASASSGIIIIGDGSTAITNSFVSDDQRFNSKVAKIIVKSSSVLNLSK